MRGFSILIWIILVQTAFADDPLAPFRTQLDQALSTVQQPADKAANLNAFKYWLDRYSERKITLNELPAALSPQGIQQVLAVLSPSTKTAVNFADVLPDLDKTDKKTNTDVANEYFQTHANESLTSKISSEASAVSQPKTDVPDYVSQAIQNLRAAATAMSKEVSGASGDTSSSRRPGSGASGGRPGPGSGSSGSTAGPTSSESPAERAAREKREAEAAKREEDRKIQDEIARQVALAQTLNPNAFGGGAGGGQGGGGSGGGAGGSGSGSSSGDKGHGAKMPELKFNDLQKGLDEVLANTKVNGPTLDPSVFASNLSGNKDDQNNGNGSNDFNINPVSLSNNNSDKDNSGNTSDNSGSGSGATPVADTSNSGDKGAGKNTRYNPNAGGTSTPNALPLDAGGAQGPAAGALASNPNGGNGNAYGNGRPGSLMGGAGNPGGSAIAGDPYPNTGREPASKGGSFDLVKTVAYGGAAGGGSDGDGGGGAGNNGEGGDAPVAKVPAKFGGGGPQLMASLSADKNGQRGIFGYMGLLRTVCRSNAGGDVTVCQHPRALSIVKNSGGPSIATNILEGRI